MTYNRKYVLVTIALVAVLFLTAGVSTVGAQPDCSEVSYDGDGRSANPLEISNVDQLQCIDEWHADASSRDEALTLNYRLVSDIDALETASWDGGKGFEPIGRLFGGTKRFTGKLDGNGHEITDLTINRGSSEHVGVFEIVGTSGTVTNVSFVDIAVTGDRRVGGLAGVNEGTISDSSVTGNVVGNGRVGGLVGLHRGEGIVSNSSASGDVTGSGEVGGLVGFASTTVSNSSASGDVEGGYEVGGLVGQNQDTVTKSSASGNVVGDDEVGGLVGQNVKGTVTESSASGDVTGTESVGGLVGENVKATVTESSASGDVEGEDSVGGFVGENGGTVEKSYARGNVTGNVSVGGFVGRNEYVDRRETSYNPGTVSESYATGEVTPLLDIDPIPDPGPGPIPDPSLSDVGGLVGNNSNGTVTDSYWDITGRSSSDGGTGLTTEEMTGSTAADNMTGFDFTGTWETVSGDYPILTWQKEGGGDGDSSSPVEGVSDELWSAVTADDDEDGLSLADLGNAIQEYQKNPSDADVDGVSIGLSDLGSLIQYYRTEVV